MLTKEVLDCRMEQAASVVAIIDACDGRHPGPLLKNMRIYASTGRVSIFDLET